MTGALYGVGTQEEAYRTWRVCGRSPMATVNELRRKGFHLTRDTIYAWMTKFSWKERADRAEAEERRVREAMGEEAAGLVADLERQKARYERFFDSLGEGVDNQGIYAYTTIIKAIVEAKKKAKPDLYAMTPLVMDRFVRFIKEHATPGERAVQDAVFALIDRFFEEVKPDGV